MMGIKEFYPFRKKEAMGFNRTYRCNKDAGNATLKSEGGFTILEVLFSVSIFAIGLLGVCALQVAAIKTISAANYITEGTTYAQDKLEELLELPYSNADFSLGDHTDTDPPGGYAITWNVTANTTTSKSVMVTSTWQNVNGATVRSRLNFIKYNW